MTSDNENERDYEVGYGKPPRHTRFRKGQSGNPLGRPRGTKNLKTLLSEALNEPVIVTENGRHRKVSKREVIITQLVNRSAKADLRAIKILLDTLRDVEGQTDPASPEASSFTAADQKVIEQLKALLLPRKPDHE
jgi:protein subunit release factor A